MANSKADPYHALIAMDECSNPKCRMCPTCIALLNEAIRQHLGTHETGYIPAAVALGRKGGLANKGIPKPASAANGLKGGRPKGSKNKPKKKP